MAEHDKKENLEDGEPLKKALVNSELERRKHRLAMKSETAHSLELPSQMSPLTKEHRSQATEGALPVQRANKRFEGFVSEQGGFGVDQLPSDKLPSAGPSVELSGFDIPTEKDPLFSARFASLEQKQVNANTSISRHETSTPNLKATFPFVSQKKKEEGTPLPTSEEGQLGVKKIALSNSSLSASLELKLGELGALPSSEGFSVKEDPLLGCLVAKRFRVLSLLGKGGMGKVYLALQEGLNRKVAIKFLHTSLSKDHEKSSRFHREAQAMARLNHPNSVSVYDFGVWEELFYIAMEFLEGYSLRELLVKEQGVLSAKRIVKILLQVCDALFEAHGSGVIHRDLKPENIMISAVEGSEEVKVVDFGLVSLIDEDDAQRVERLTVEGMTVGTPAYMSPEQVQGHSLDGRSDIYALGVMLYECICGKRPFGGSNWTVMMQHMYADPKLPSQRNSDIAIDSELEKIALWAIEKNPDDRPTSVALFRERLLEYLDGPSEVEASVSTLEASFGDRTSRAEAVGIPKQEGAFLDTFEGPTINNTLEEITVVFENTKSFATSLTARLRASRYSVRPTNSFEEVVELMANNAHHLLLVDIRPNPHVLMELLRQEMVAGTLQGKAVIVVGPERDVELMQLALSSGFKDYLVEAQLSKKLTRSVKKTFRQLSRKSRIM